MKEEKLDYDVQKQARAGTAAIFRALISVYIIYLAWSILRGVLDGSSPIPVWAGWLAAIVFTAAAAAFGVYTWKTWRRDLEAARLPEDDGEADGNEELDTDGDADAPDDHAPA